LIILRSLPVVRQGPFPRISEIPSVKLCTRAQYCTVPQRRQNPNLKRKCPGRYHPRSRLYKWKSRQTQPSQKLKQKGHTRRLTRGSDYNVLEQYSTINITLCFSMSSHSTELEHFKTTSMAHPPSPTGIPGDKQENYTPPTVCSPLPSGLCSIILGKHQLAEAKRNVLETEWRPYKSHQHLRRAYEEQEEA